jgi:hypothetical protein
MTHIMKMKIIIKKGLRIGDFNGIIDVRGNYGKRKKEETT